MKLVITKNYAEMSAAAAKIVLARLQANPKLVLGLATGATPEGLYEILVKSYQAKKADFSKVTTFNLDEYVGIAKSHPLSYDSYMKTKLFNHINVAPHNIHIPDGNGDLKANAKAYEAAIKAAGGIDLQILGIGENAHIAFNEPGSKATDLTRVVDLTPSTINANARYFKSASEVPKTAISMGIGSILGAREIILLASGPKKAAAIKATLEGKVSSSVPSSFLQNHPNVTIIVDEAAASLLKTAQLAS